MDRPNFVLATLALQGTGVSLSPVQVQKLFFILDREIPNDTGGPYFDFEPYDYGPFDAAVYQELKSLEENGFAKTAMGNFVRVYQLTDQGLQKGLTLADSLPEPAREYIKDAGSFVRRLSFQQLVSSIYKKYPEMRAKSVFRA